MEMELSQSTCCLPPQLLSLLLLTSSSPSFVMALYLSVFGTVPKKNKDFSCSSNYHPIALASSLSKLLEHLILIHYSAFLYTSPLQFGFKPGSSTALCTGLVKNIISRYNHSGSSVHGCFLDASKAFDLLDHGLLFQKLIDRGLPLPVVHFLS